MTAFVILTGGRGTRIGRVGDSLHKCLVPLAQRAIISHLIELAPRDARVVISLGYRGNQVRDYVELAHPDRDITFVDDEMWNKPGSGPGTGLSAVRDVVGDDNMIFTSCDTIWRPDPTLWDAETSWSAVATMPVGTNPERWCRILSDDEGRVVRIVDKQPSYPDARETYVGLSMIKQCDLGTFWYGIESFRLVENERQVTGGLSLMAAHGQLEVRRVDWTDVGDAVSYRHAVIERDGYDWSKSGEATWLLPESGRVVKFFHNEKSAAERCRRALVLQDAVPKIVDERGKMFAYEYVPGTTFYAANGTTHSDTAVDRLVDWAESTIWRSMMVDPLTMVSACRQFYYAKTIERVAQLRPELRALTYDAVSRVDWKLVTNNGVPVRWHGDFNFGNIIWNAGTVHAIDWRSDFAGFPWGDRRYDVAKLLVGCRINWDNVRRGDFAPWIDGARVESRIRTRLNPGTDVDMIAALTLVNSAPLHEPPLDEVLVVQAARWLERI